MLFAAAARSAPPASGTKTTTSKFRATVAGPAGPRQAALRRLSPGVVGAVAVSDLVAVPADGGRTVSEVARVLSAPEALSARVCCKLSVSGGWLSDVAGVVLSEAGTCPDAARGTIKRLNPSSRVARKMECIDINGLAVRIRCDTMVSAKIAAPAGRGRRVAVPSGASFQRPLTTVQEMTWKAKRLRRH